MHAETAVRSEDLAQRWNVLATDPEAPDYYELNEFGEVILSPRPTNLHQLRVQSVVDELNRQLGPRAVSEVSVLTDRGIRVPDVSWMPTERWNATRAATPLPIVPDVCVEVLSPGNTQEEIAMKVGAYLRGGAREVIVVSVSGESSFHGPEGRRDVSSLGIVLSLEGEPDC
jgi:Uma2 family endonuclease